MNGKITMRKGQLLLLLAVVAYWVSPFDLLPGMPFDDIAAAYLAWHNRDDPSPYLEGYLARLAEFLRGDDK